MQIVSFPHVASHCVLLAGVEKLHFGHSNDEFFARAFDVFGDSVQVCQDE